MSTVLPRRLSWWGSTVFSPENLLSLRQNLTISDWNYQHSLLNPDRLFMHKDDAKITSMMKNILDHRQLLRSNERSSAAVTGTEPAPIASGTEPMTNLPDGVFRKKKWQKRTFSWVCIAYVFFFFTLLQRFVPRLEILFCFNHFF